MAAYPLAKPPPVDLSALLGQFHANFKQFGRAAINPGLGLFHGVSHVRCRRAEHFAPGRQQPPQFLPVRVSGQLFNDVGYRVGNAKP